TLDRENGILAHHIVERLVRAIDGSLVLGTVGSTLPIAESRTHAGIARTRRFAFEMSSLRLAAVVPRSAPTPRSIFHSDFRQALCETGCQPRNLHAHLANWTAAQPAE